MVTGIEERSAWIEPRVNWATAVVVLLTLATPLGCSKREPQAPNPEPPAAAAPPPPAPLQMAPPAESDDSWPGAGGAGAVGAAKGEGPAEKKPASAAPESANEVESADRARDKRSESAPRKAAPAKPKANISLGQAAKEDDDQLAEWGRSVALLEQSFDQFEDALELATPDCPAADKFRQTVCSLAEHICSLEEQVPNSTKRQCDDGRQRCAQAGQKYRARCDKE